MSTKGVADALLKVRQAIGKSSLKKPIAEKVPEIPLSICIMSNQKDANYMPGCIRSLPKYCEVIWCVNEPGEGSDVFTITKQIYNEDRNIKQCEYINQKDNFSFSNIRNKMLETATRDWIFTIDADERIANEYDTDWLTFLNTIPSNVGGLNINIFSFNKQMKHGKGWGQSQAACRLFRNDEDIRYVFRAHEQIKYSITTQRYEIINSALLLNHYGYLGENPQELYNKYTRNTDLMIRDLNEEYKGNVHLKELLRSHLNNTKQLEEMYNGNNTKS